MSLWTVWRCGCSHARD